MKKSEFSKLKEIDFQDLLRDVIESFREISIRLEFHEVVSYLFLALVYKDLKDNKDIEGYVIANSHINEISSLYMKKILSKVQDNFIEELANKYDENKLKAAILFSKPEKFSEMDVHSTPEGVSNLALRLLDIKKGDKVLDMGSGVNSFLIQAGINSPEITMNGIEVNTGSVIVANIRSLITNLDIDVKQGNILSQDYTDLMANKVFSNPPLGMRWANIEKEVKHNKNLMKYFSKAKRTISGDWVYALSALLTQKQPGKTVVIMSNGGTWNKPDEFIRRKLIEKGLIEGVITLPVNLLSHTAIDLIMMIFSQGNDRVKMVDASEIYTNRRRLNILENEDIERIIDAYNNETDISREVTIEEIKNQDYILNPHRYVVEDLEIENAIRLGDVCKSINRGAMISSKELDKLATSEETDWQYLRLQNINDGEIDEDLPYLHALDESYEKYCIKDNNLIISKLSPYKISLTHIPGDKKILATGNLYFLELDEEKVNPIFLENYLQSEMGIAQLNRYSTGTVMKNISIRDLRKIQIPNIPIQEQNRIGEEIQLLNEELIILQRQADIIKDKKAKIIQEVI